MRSHASRGNKVVNAHIKLDQHPYRGHIPGGYLMSMIAQTSETIFSPAVILWILASLLAAMLLIGASSRRRAKLTDSLRSYVDKHQQKTKTGSSDAASNDDAKN